MPTPQPGATTNTTIHSKTSKSTRRRTRSQTKRGNATPSTAGNKQKQNNPFLCYAQNLYENTWSSTGGAKRSLNATSTTRPVGNSNLSATARSNSTTVRGNASSTSPLQYENASHLVLRDFSLKIASFLSKQPTMDDSLALRYTSKQIQDRFQQKTARKNLSVRGTSAGGSHSKTLLHSISPLQMIKEMKRSSREQIKELIIVFDESCLVDGASSSSNAAGTKEQKEQQQTKTSPPEKTSQKSASQKLARAIKKLPVLSKLSHLRVECAPQHDLNAQILHQIMSTSPLKRIEVVPELLHEDVTRAMALKNSVKRFEILPQKELTPTNQQDASSPTNEEEKEQGKEEETQQESDEQQAESPAERLQKALVALFVPSTEDQVSSLRHVHLRNASLSTIQSMIHLRISSLHIENDETFSGGASDQSSESSESQEESEEQVVPRLSALKECSICSNDSKYTRHILYTICPANLEKLHLSTRSNNDSSLLEFDQEAINHLTNLQAVKLRNVSPSSTLHLLKSAKSAVQKLHISFDGDKENLQLLDNNLIAALAACSDLSSVFLSSVQVSNQFFVILDTYCSPLYGLTMRDVRWAADSSSWDKPEPTETPSEAEQLENSLRAPAASNRTSTPQVCDLRAAWFERVTFKAPNQEEEAAPAAKGKKAKGKGKAPAVDESAEEADHPDDADFASFCASVPLLESLVLCESNIGDGHLEILTSQQHKAQNEEEESSQQGNPENHQPAIRHSLRNLEIANSTREIKNPKLTTENTLTHLERLSIWSTEKPTYLNLATLIRLALLCPKLESLQIVPQFPTKPFQVSSCQIFEEMRHFGQETPGSMWGTYLKDCVFKREIIPRIVSELDAFYSKERDRSRVRSGMNCLLRADGSTKVGSSLRSKQGGKPQEQHRWYHVATSQSATESTMTISRCLDMLYNSIFSRVGNVYD